MWIKYLFSQLPSDERQLESIATSLGVSLFGTVVTSAGHTGYDTYELQKRIVDAVRYRRDSWMWFLAVIAAFASLASALAAWVAVSR